MKYEIVRLEEKMAAGISARTNNQDPQMSMVIGALWNRFFGEGIFGIIPGKANEKALGIYTDYAGNEKDDYTVMTACEIRNTPDGEKGSDKAADEAGLKEKGVEVRRIPAGPYARFIVKGDMRTAVARCWEEIWKLNLPRSFACDFEEYQNDGMEEAEIHIYIGLREDAVTAPCGAVCDGCREYGSSCGGCRERAGKPSWLPYIGKEICPLYDCPINEHKYKTCAECSQLPCRKFMDLRDPGMSDEAFAQSVADRVGVLKNLKR